MKLQKTTHFQAMMKKSFFWRFLYENEMKRNPSHAAETHTSVQCWLTLTPGWRGQGQPEGFEDRLEGS